MAAINPSHLLPAIGYLAVVSALLLARQRCPSWLHPIAVIVGLPVRAAQSGVGETLLALGAAVLVLGVALVVAASMTSGVTLWSVAAALALLPLPSGWLWLGVGLLMAGVVALWQLARAGGMQRIMLVVVPVLHGLGVRPWGMGVPDVDALPTRDDLTKAHGGASGRGRVYLSLYLLAGLVAAVVFSYTTTPPY